MSSFRTWDLVDCKRRYFIAPVSDDNDFRTVSALLRKVADYVDEIDLQDPEFHGLITGLEFGEEDRSYRTATLLFTEEDTAPTTND